MGMAGHTDPPRLPPAGGPEKSKMTTIQTVTGGSIEVESRLVKTADGRVGKITQVGSSQPIPRAMRRAAPRGTVRVLWCEIGGQQGMISLDEANADAYDSATAKARDNEARAAKMHALTSTDYTAYAYCLDRARSEAYRYQGDFDAMMSDGDNDGARPPRPEDRSWLVRAKEIAAANPRVTVERKARMQADADPSGRLGFLQRQAGQRALDMLTAGEPDERVLAELESYRHDPGYAEAVWD